MKSAVSKSSTLTEEEPKGPNLMLRQLHYLAQLCTLGYLDLLLFFLFPLLNSYD